MNKDRNTVQVTIDNKPYRVKKGLTILEAAKQNNIYIPTLCAHEELTPYGGCRMCIVEVEGMRTFPTACTTPIEEGMIIRTHTAQVQSIRKEILQLFLSEHTSSCLICEEKEECKTYMGTIRKAGVTTGCRYCPKDGQCELQEVVERFEITEIVYPIYYRHLQVEKEDPFYDRDYNLCILCGRCVRMCQEVRLANVLAFKQRGRNTIIGPAYARTHLEAGCEFCGACVEVCPTGTLSEKARKWEGIAQREELTTCSYCAVGCQIRLQIKEDRVIGSLPADDPLVNNDQLCVKGRFCITEMVNGPHRLRRPYHTLRQTWAEVSWEDAITVAVEKLSQCDPEEFALHISANCSNEDLYIAQKFARVAMKSNNIDIPARLFYGNSFNAYVGLMKRAVPLKKVKDASVILCLGLDSRFGRSVVGVELRRAMKRGAKIITIHPRDHNLTLIADEWIQPFPGSEAEILHSLVQMTAGNKMEVLPENGDLGEKLNLISQLLKSARSPVILIGTEFLSYGSGAEILLSVDQLAENINAGVLPLPAQNNLFGSILMGAYPEILPGGYAVTNTEKIRMLEKSWEAKLPDFSVKWDSGVLNGPARKKVLYLIGETLPDNGSELPDFVIFQNIYPPEHPGKADLVLPAAAFTEVNGTFINGEGRVQRIRKAATPPGTALPDWEILCRIARKMGVSGFDFSSAEEIHREIAAWQNGFDSFKHPARQARPLTCEAEFSVPHAFTNHNQTDKKYPFLLCASPVEHSYRGFSLSSRVDGARKIFPDGTLYINPQDARKARLSEGDQVEVSSNQFKKIWSVKLSEAQPRNVLHVTLSQGESLGPNPYPVRIRKKNV